jgi:hypothetical protein
MTTYENRLSIATPSILTGRQLAAALMKAPPIQRAIQGAKLCAGVTLLDRLTPAQSSERVGVSAYNVKLALEILEYPRLVDLVQKDYGVTLPDAVRMKKKGMFTRVPFATEVPVIHEVPAPLAQELLALNDALARIRQELKETSDALASVLPELAETIHEVTNWRDSVPAASDVTETSSPVEITTITVTKTPDQVVTEIPGVLDEDDEERTVVAEARASGDIASFLKTHGLATLGDAPE